MVSVGFHRTVALVSHKQTHRLNYGQIQFENMDAYDYIPSQHFVSVVQENCPFAKCEPKKHGYTCFVDIDDKQSESFAIIDEGQEDHYFYYDTQAALKRTRLHLRNGREYDTDHVTERILNTDKSPVIREYLQRHETRLINDRENAPSGMPRRMFPSTSIEESEPLHERILLEDTISDGDLPKLFEHAVEKRRQQINNEDKSEEITLTWNKLVGYRIEPL